MSTESLKRTSNVIKDPSQVINTRVNVDVLKQRLIMEQKKENNKKAVIFLILFSALASFVYLTY